MSQPEARPGATVSATAKRLARADKDARRLRSNSRQRRQRVFGRQGDSFLALFGMIDSVHTPSGWKRVKRYAAELHEKIADGLWKNRP